MDELSGNGTPYELTDGGSTIMVPQDQVYDLRLQLSGDSLRKQNAPKIAAA